MRVSIEIFLHVASAVACLAFSVQGLGCNGGSRLSGDAADEGLEPGDGLSDLADSDAQDLQDEVFPELPDTDAADLPAEDAGPAVAWSRLYYSPNQLNPVQAADGGFLGVATPSRDGIVKLDSLGIVEWCRVYESVAGNGIYGILPRPGGGFMVYGHAPVAYWGGGIWVAELDATGSITWQKAYVGQHHSRAISIQEAPDGGFVFSGQTESCSGEYLGDGLAVRLDPDGAILWQHCYGGDGSDSFYRVVAVAGDRYLLGGDTGSFGEASRGFWLVMVDGAGQILWQRGCGGLGAGFTDMDACADGGFVACGMTDSFGLGEEDFWVIRIDEDGDILWQEALGTPYEDQGFGAACTWDGGVILAGTTESPDSRDRAVLVRLDPNGEILWQRSYGTFERASHFRGVHQTMDLGFLAWGFSMDLPIGSQPAWLLKVYEEGEISPDCPAGYVEPGPLVASATDAVMEETWASPIPAGLWSAETENEEVDCTVGVITDCDSQ